MAKLHKNVFFWTSKLGSVLCYPRKAKTTAHVHHHVCSCLLTVVWQWQRAQNWIEHVKKNSGAVIMMSFYLWTVLTNVPIEFIYGRLEEMLAQSWVTRWESCRCSPQVAPGPVRGHHCQDGVQPVRHFQRNRNSPAQVWQRVRRGALRESERNGGKENDDVRVSQDITEMMVEHSSD